MNIVYVELFRSKVRNTIIFILSIFLIISVYIYIGNIMSITNSIDNVGESIPVKFIVSNSSFTRSNGIVIDEKSIQRLSELEIENEAYTIQVGGNINPQNQLTPVQVCDTNILAGNSIDAFQGIEEDDIVYADTIEAFSWDSGENVCIVSNAYASQYSISLNDEISLPLYYIDYHDYTPNFSFVELGEHKLKVVGIFEGEYDILTTTKYLESVIQSKELQVYYSSYYGYVSDPINLNDFKSSLNDNFFIQVRSSNDESLRGNAVTIYDDLFISTVTKLNSNLTLFNQFIIPFILLLILIKIFSNYLIFKKSKREILLYSLLGMSKVRLFFNYFIYVIVIDVVCMIFFLLIGQVFLDSLLINIYISIIYLLVEIVSISVSLIFIMKFNLIYELKEE